MHVIISGGTGLIGRALAAELAAGGHQITILSRSAERPAGLPANIQMHAWDARTAAGWGHLVETTDAIINLAGANLSEKRWTAEQKERIRASRINAGAAIVEAIKRAARKPSLLLQASATGYYGPQQSEPPAETAAPGNDFLARVCLDWEAATAPVETLGVRRIILRTGVVLSTEPGGALAKMVLPFRFFVGGPLGNGQQWFPWIHLADEVAAIRFLLEHPTAAGPFNLGAPQPLTNAQFSRAIGQTLRRPSWLPVPAPALKLLFGEMSTVLLTGQRALPAKLLELGFEFKYSSAQTALKNLLTRG